MAKKVAPQKAVAKKTIAKAPVKKVIPAKVVVKQAPKKAVPAKPIAKKIVDTKPIVKKQEPTRTPAPAKRGRTKTQKKDRVQHVPFQRQPIVIPPTPKIKKLVNAKQPMPPVNTDNRTRYSDAELEEFKEIIINKLKEARSDYEMLMSSLSHAGDNGTDDTAYAFKMMEEGSETLSREETAQLASRQEKFISALENALIRIKNKTYGICRATGKLIRKERLRLVPHATLSIEAKMQQ